jgi:aspartyl-tRNA(Asn)/glutamyl-tRNA(Gln) amidotransferase subunit B
MAAIASVQLIVGMEVHVELATRSKMFSRAPNPASPEFDAAAPNTLIDPVVLALPGALPVMNKAAVEVAMMVGLALGCRIAEFTKWDRKSYFYPDLPKGYQISQYDLPLCGEGAFEVPATDERGFVVPDAAPTRIGIIRAHLEEDAGKLLHEVPALSDKPPVARSGDFSIVDLNRAGTPLLEIVTAPDFRAADECVAFARQLRNICRFLGASEGVMQKGHMRFEPNINCVLTLDDGRTVKTPIVEVKNLNSFKSLRGAIEHELAEQPGRWRESGREMTPGSKSTRGWDDVRGVTFLQREKEEAHDYRYFPDPDLLPVTVSDEWRESVRARIPELPLSRLRRYMSEYGLGVKEAAALVDERDVCFFYDATIREIVALGVPGPRAGKLAANYILQNAAKRANERGVLASELGITPGQIAQIAKLREVGSLGSNAADELFGSLCQPEGLPVSSRGLSESSSDTPGQPPAAASTLKGGHSDVDVTALARERGLLTVRDDAALDRWIDQVIAANEKVAADVRAGKLAAAGRLVGEVMKLSGGQADAKTVRERILQKLGAL